VESTKSEARNPKRIPMFKEAMIKTARHFTMVCLTMVFIGGVIHAQGKGSTEPTETKPAGKAAAKNAAKKEAGKGGKGDAGPVTDKQEEAVNKFVEEHHPELSELLKHLKESKQHRPYDRAMRELFTVSERLGNLKKSDETRYGLELKAWQVKSRVQLLTARLSMDDNEPLKQELRRALAQQYDLRRETLSLEKNRLSERVQKLDKDLIDYDANREASLDKQFQQLTSTSKPKPAGKTKPAKGTTKP